MKMIAYVVPPFAVIEKGVMLEVYDSLHPRLSN
jgi:hypothetical protein